MRITSPRRPPIPLGPNSLWILAAGWKTLQNTASQSQYLVTTSAPGLLYDRVAAGRISNTNGATGNRQYRGDSECRNR